MSRPQMLSCWRRWTGLVATGRIAARFKRHAICPTHPRTTPLMLSIATIRIRSTKVAVAISMLLPFYLLLIQVSKPCF
ncbi:glucan endo-1 3-beta-glucosidase 4 [Phtheirospermum japonicum]|uniref:Glucan endo-1 3-beta-glucosidase 4 n=1 Tax=Phtheirospermum japonicum TaxID=374723 RepID=A0A830AZL4_9LAMI|nr:glucan endo-1 3-beta-glucosidase 4 [Phtheirospermum japonicum]